MTFSLDLPEHLATPFEFQSVQPPSLGWPLLAAENSADGDAPGHLIRARAAVQRCPDLPVAWSRLAQAAQAASEPEEAIDAAIKTIDLSSVQLSPPAIHAAVVVLSAYDQRDALTAFLTSAAAGVVPKELLVRIAIQVGEGAIAAQILERTDWDDAFAVRGWVQLQHGEFQAAIASLRRGQKAGLEGPSVLANLGYAHAALGNLEKAIHITRQAAALAPKSRLIAFNLIGFLRAAGDYDSAIALIDRLRVGPRLDIELALMLADLLNDTGAKGKAHDVLQRIRISEEWTTTDRVRRSELEANLAFLRWVTDRQNRANATRAVLRALSDCDYRSLPVAYLLMNLTRTPEEAPKVGAALDALAGRHREESLFGLRMHHAILRRDSTDAVRYSQAWADQDIFNPIAAAVAVHLLTDVAGKAAAGADLGLAALLRSPASPLLANNTAYALCAASRPEEARRVLARFLSDPGEDVALVATSALIDLLVGNVERGLAGYGHARDIAEKSGNHALGYLVQLNMALAIQRLPDEVREQLPPQGSCEIPAKWADRTDFWVISRRICRELGETSVTR